MRWTCTNVIIYKDCMFLISNIFSVFFILIRTFYYVFEYTQGKEFGFAIQLTDMP